MRQLFILLVIIFSFSCESEVKKNSNLIFEDETNFKSLRQVTFGGDNAEAYWSFDDKKLIFQSNNNNWGVECDQMFVMDFDDTFDKSQPKMVSTGNGRTTCSYFLPDNEHFIYASTHLKDDNCPEALLRKEGKYVWPIYDSFDIFIPSSCQIPNS